MYCDYLGTDGLSAEAEGKGDIYKDVERKGRLGQLGGLYSHFRPARKEPETKVRRPHPAGDVPGHPNTSTSYPSDPGPSSGESEEGELVSQNVSLDAHELFSQLCTVTNIVKMGPHRGLFLSIVNVHDGVVRIFRDWLNHQANKSVMDGDIEKRTLWVDDRRNAGLVLRVKEKKWKRDSPILFRDEDVAVSYNIEYERKCDHTMLCCRSYFSCYLCKKAYGKLQIYVLYALLPGQEDMHDICLLSANNRSFDSHDPSSSHD